MDDVSSEEGGRVARTGAGRYLISWAALVALTGLTFELAQHDLGAGALVYAMVIAVAKGSLVVLFFMHLWDHRGANRLVFAVSLLLVAVLAGLVVIDVSTRFPLARPH